MGQYWHERVLIDSYSYLDECFYKYFVCFIPQEVLVTQQQEKLNYLQMTPQPDQFIYFFASLTLVYDAPPQPHHWKTL